MDLRADVSYICYVGDSSAWEHRPRSGAVVVHRGPRWSLLGRTVAGCVRPCPVRGRGDPWRARLVLADHRMGARSRDRVLGRRCVDDVPPASGRAGRARCRPRSSARPVRLSRSRGLRRRPRTNTTPAATGRRRCTSSGYPGTCRRCPSRRGTLRGVPGWRALYCSRCLSHGDLATSHGTGPAVSADPDGRTTGRCDAAKPVPPATGRTLDSHAVTVSRTRRGRNGMRTARRVRSGAAPENSDRSHASDSTSSNGANGKS